MIGLGSKSTLIHIIDFGLSKRYWDPLNGKHIEFMTNKSMAGTLRYASINTQSGYEQGRRDDLESASYILLYFLKGSLPWQKIVLPNKKEKYRKICEIKKSMSPEMLCSGMPYALLTMMKYCRDLKFDENPNYDMLKKLLKEAF